MASDNSFPKKGEIWLVDYTANFSGEFEIESRIKKLRPSVILSNNIQNENSNDVLVAPITSLEVDNVEITEVFLNSSEESRLDRNSKALIHIIRTVDKKYRLKNFIGKVSDDELKKIEGIIRLIFEV